MQFVESAAKL